MGRIAKRTTFEGAVADEVRHWLACTIEERVSGVEAIEVDDDELDLLLLGD